MFEVLDSLIQPERAIMLLIALSVFATIVTVAAPMLEGDKLRGRMKQVASERDRLRASHKVGMSGGTESRLREQSKGSLSQIVDILNLRKVFEAEASREKLRQAGYRSERHLIVFLALRLVTPYSLVRRRKRRQQSDAARRYGKPLL